MHTHVYTSSGHAQQGEWPTVLKLLQEECSYFADSFQCLKNPPLPEGSRNRTHSLWGVISTSHACLLSPCCLHSLSTPTLPSDLFFLTSPQGPRCRPIFSSLTIFGLASSTNHPPSPRNLHFLHSLEKSVLSLESHLVTSLAFLTIN